MPIAPTGEIGGSVQSKMRCSGHARPSWQGHARPLSGESLNSGCTMRPRKPGAPEAASESHTLPQWSGASGSQTPHVVEGLGPTKRWASGAVPVAPSAGANRVSNSSGPLASFSSGRGFCTHGSRTSVMKPACLTEVFIPTSHQKNRSSKRSWIRSRSISCVLSPSRRVPARSRESVPRIVTISSRTFKMRRSLP